MAKGFFMPVNANEAAGSDLLSADHRTYISSATFQGVHIVSQNGSVGFSTFYWPGIFGLSKNAHKVICTLHNGSKVGMSLQNGAPRDLCNVGWDGKCIGVAGSETNRFGLTHTANSGSFKLYASNLQNWSSSNVFSGKCPVTITNDTWTHYALVYQKSSGTFTVYVNGSSVGTATYTMPNREYNINIAGDNMGRFAGKISDVILSSTARYTANFTKPTSAPSTSSTVGNIVRLFYYF